VAVNFNEILEATRAGPKDSIGTGESLSDSFLDALL
jgi:hypothetical protein